MDSQTRCFGLSVKSENFRTFLFLGFRTVEGWRGSAVLFFGTVKGWRGSGNFGSGTSLLNTGIFRIFSQICSENFENFGQKKQICPEIFIFF